MFHGREIPHTAPIGKRKVRISKAKYDLVRETILEIIRAYGEIGFTEILIRLEQVPIDKLEGSISRYPEMFKLDLESWGEIERVPDASPQKIRLK